MTTELETANRHHPLTSVLVLLLGALAVAFLAYDPRLYVLTVAHLTMLPALAYPLVYRRSPWKKGPTGKALMNMARAVALLYFVGLFRIWWPLPGTAELYAIVVTYLGLAITYQFTVMLQLKRQAARERDPSLQP